MRTRTRIAALAGVIAAASVTGIAVAAVAAPDGDPQDHGSSAAQEEVLLGHGSDHLPSVTATDWVTYADHVIVVEAVSEQTVPPTQRELDRGEGVIGRTVSLEIDEVLWSREGAPQPAPETWDYSALGWQFTDGDLEDTLKMAMADFPRIEVGHRYVMAIRWEEAVCTAEGDDAPAQWRGLGEGSEIPYDDETLGNGESEGSETDVEAFAAEAGPEQGVEEILAGESADALVSLLESTQPDVAAQSEVEAFAAATECG